ncbi:sugar phosphate isomerase/epimerase family protein [Rhodopirellula halodulae]|uniref:sugar phosphate isomerase/epimerase family protein n=1 Tax=Rhodopirellula halodulae TaxID=2894198 RepID=UPI001E4F96B5|nr:sugar phosphate isomerase/epimerase family protein [Rhodopirellula sp. JC737]MCC9655388.1 sugar phosphate isomerase/epimerase [Rhodopirellula sp. JC737]
MSFKSAITVSLVEEARGGPFVYWDGMQDACEKASALAFDAIEIFAPGPDAVDEAELKGLLEKHNLVVAAVGTGAGMVKHGLSLTNPDADHRAKARDFVKQMIDFGGVYNAPAIIGSMQGKWGGDVSRDQALAYLREALNELGPYAAQHNVPLFYEPLNRYETNLLRTVAEGVEFCKTLDNDNIKLLADLFHMNIEEADLAAAIREGKGYVGHIHFVDSNRQAAGMGHMDHAPIIAALKDIGYDGYLCAEAFALPDSDTAARNTIEAFKRLTA